jgi:hypothetical protein
MAQQQPPPVGKGVLIIKDSISHSDTPQSVGLLWTSDQNDAETSTCQETALTSDIRASRGIRTQDTIKRAAAEPGLRSRGHWDRQITEITNGISDYQSDAGTYASRRI